MISSVAKQIKWLGHDGFSIQSVGAHVVIDPYQVKELAPADIILVTHAHYDHCSVADIEKLQTDGTVIITEPESAQKLSGDVRIVKPGDTLTVNGIQIEAVPAYNTNKKFHPKSKNWLGFVVTIDGVRIYHAGDTDLIDEMADLSVDIALLPVSGTYVMTAEEAVQAVKRIQPKMAIPMHYDSIVGSRADAESFKHGLSGVCDVVISDKL